nr:M64 family metallopeptidase [uncultured Carboxylicivirga sp.]
MQKVLVNIIIFFGITSCLRAQTFYDEHFEDKSMRIDLILAGNKDSQTVYISEFKKEPYWGGSKQNLIDSFNYGEYRYFIIDEETSDTLYSRGFCTLFEEWRSTEEAKHMNKAFYQTVTFPFPKHEFSFVLNERHRDGSFSTMLSQKIDPTDVNIRQTQTGKYEVAQIINNGPSDQMVDLLFIAEGYTANEMDKFKNDVKKQAEYLLSQSPYLENKDKFNFWAVCSPSKDSGPSEPEKGIWKETAVNSAFNTFYVDRYLETTDVKAIRDIAAEAPYDHIVVLVNSKRYGGGGIYNHFSLGTADNHLANTVLIHELGHGLFGLADEYYTSDVAYEDFFDLKVEPWQPNITTLVDFDSKWKGMISTNTPVPTPTGSEFDDQTGVFEGGGYVSKGVYRPAVNCRMKSNEAAGFCDVCKDAGNKMIIFLTQHQ